jgi:DNA helicase-2/ATP-dependent DNA helicase PcrA
MVELDRKQSAIVNSTEPNIVVVAGAGSGKTAVLTQRVRHIITDCNIKPSDIVAITFTNMAADEMKERLADIPDISDAFIGTIHSFANRLLRKSGKRYSILSDECFLNLCAELIDKYCTYLTRKRLVEIVELARDVSFGKIDTEKKEQFEKFMNSEEGREYEAITRKFVADDDGYTIPESVYSLCRERSILTFDELIRKAKEYFESTGTRLEYVFVDEYQDVGNLEDDFIRSLNAKNYFIVGDDWQSIYGFKGANVGIFKSYIRSKNWQTYYLTNNYRNCTSVIALADKVIEQVADRIDKKIAPQNRMEGEVKLGSKADLNASLEIIKNQQHYSKWFILVRTRSDLTEMLMRCAEVGLPAITFSRTGLSQKEVEELLNVNAVKVLTIHASKGLETDNVLLYGNFPVQESKHRKPNPEERRVMYVGCTRARNKLVILTEQ